jgi:hypothetical protein
VEEKRLAELCILPNFFQDAIEDLAEMKRIQDAIFNLSKSRQTAGSCS